MEEILVKPAHRGVGLTGQRSRERLVTRLRRQGIASEAVLEVIRHTPRHLFVDEALADRAYEDTALPLGYGQTISQPYIVARMSEALLQDGIPEDVLEVGTGSGYQTAVLARLVPRVYSIERIAGLSQQARRRMRELGLSNVRLRHSDGESGWPGRTEFAAMIVTAAPEQLPRALLHQLRLGGRMVVPVGPRRGQELRLVTRTRRGFEERVLEKVCFVPMLEGLD